MARLALPGRFHALVGGTVVTAWGLVLVDAVHREDWEDVEPFRHFASALFLLTAAGVLVGALLSVLGALGDLLERAVARRAPRAAVVVEPVLGAALVVALAWGTAFWVFSGERIHRTPVARWGPYALLAAFAVAGAVAIAAVRWLSRRAPSGRRLTFLAGLTTLVAAALVRVDMHAYPMLYGRLHTLLELTAALVFSVGAVAYLADRAGRSAQELGRLRRFVLVASLALPLLAVVGPARRWVEESLWYAWREPVYLGRMLSRLQLAESYVHGARGPAGGVTPAIEQLLRRHDLTSVTESPEWNQPNDEAPLLRERLAALRDRKSYNLVVYYVDTLRADTARDASLMPNLARFAAQSLDFRQAYTTGSDTLHALPGIVGGSYNLFDQPDRDLLYYARSSGHLTGLVAARSAREFLSNLLPRFRFDEVLDVQDYAEGRTDVWGYGGDQATAPRIVDQGLDWLKRHQGTPTLLWLFNFDLHNWRELDAAYVQDLADRQGLHDEKNPVWRYRSLARSIDTEFGRFMDGLDSSGLAEDTVVLFVSDHGEGLGQDGFWVHSVFLWESLVKVPLMLRAPGLAPRRVTDVVSLVDVAPTLSRFAARKAETNHFDGHDLLEHALLEHPRRRHPLVMISVLNQAPVRLGIIDAHVHFKLVLPLEGAVPELYDLASPDPDGHDYSRERPDVLQHLLKTLVRAPMFPRTTSPTPAEPPAASSQSAMGAP